MLRLRDSALEVVPAEFGCNEEGDNGDESREEKPGIYIEGTPGGSYVNESDSIRSRLADSLTNGLHSLNKRK
jgi:hypothetical protein